MEEQITSPFWRQLDIFNPQNFTDLDIGIIGAGGIGSPTALALWKMGLTNVVLYDFDDIEEHNLPNQLYRKEDLGKKKVKALCDMLTAFSLNEEQPMFVPDKWDGQIHKIIILAVDSMDTRIEIWNKLKENDDFYDVDAVIDPRMGAEIMRIHTVRPMDDDSIAMYEKNLYPSSEAEEAPCTARAIIYNTFVIAGLIANQVKKVACNESFFGEIVFDLQNLLLVTGDEHTSISEAQQEGVPEGDQVAPVVEGAATSQ